MSRFTVTFPSSSLALIAVLAAAPAYSQDQAVSAQSSHELRVFDSSLVDKSVNPCENFYRYSCNGWFKRNPLPPDQTSYGRFTELYELNRLHLKEILEEASKPGANRTPNEQKIGDEYASCMDTDAINKLGLVPIQPELDRIAALRKPDELPVLLAHLHTIGVNAFFSFGSNQDFADANQVISFYGAGGLGLPERDYYFRTDAKSVEQRKQYVDHVRKMFILAGETEAQAAKDADTVMEIETRLAKASLTITEMRDPQNLNHPTDVATLSRDLTHFSLPDYVESAHAPAAGKANDMEPKFFAEFNTLIAETPIDQIRTYLRWHLLHAYAGTSMPEAFEKESWTFYSHILNGAEKQQERWKRCTGRIDREMGQALGEVYVSRYFPPAEKQQALEMTLAIEQAMARDIDSLDWMSPATKEQAKEKLKTVMNKIGYPDKWRDYSKLVIVRGDPLGNQQRVRQFDFNRELEKIGKPVDKGEWMMSPPTVNAYYDPQQNNVNFPAGYFQPPFYSDKEDAAANYGDMGSTIGHELTHGFDDEGRQFDKDGNLKDGGPRTTKPNSRRRHSAWSINITPSKRFPVYISTANLPWVRTLPISVDCGWRGSHGRIRLSQNTSTWPRKQMVTRPNSASGLHTPSNGAPRPGPNNCAARRTPIHTHPTSIEPTPSFRTCPSLARASTANCPTKW